MSDNLQQVIDDTVELYNGIYSKTHKSIIRSRVYKQYLNQLGETEAVISQTILKKIATRQPFNRKITIKKVPDAQDIELLKQDIVA